MPDTTKRRQQIDSAVEQAVKGDAPAADSGPSAKERAEVRIRRGHQRASDSRIHGNLELASKAAKDLLEGTMALNRLKKNQSTDSNN